MYICNLSIDEYSFSIGINIANNIMCFIIIRQVELGQTVPGRRGHRGGPPDPLLTKGWSVDLSFTLAPAHTSLAIPTINCEDNDEKRTTDSKFFYRYLLSPSKHGQEQKTHAALTCYMLSSYLCRVRRGRCDMKQKASSWPPL